MGYKSNILKIDKNTKLVSNIREYILFEKYQK